MWKDGRKYLKSIFTDVIDNVSCCALFIRLSWNVMKWGNGAMITLHFPTLATNYLQCIPVKSVD
jgi:hypothetical protein